MTFRSSSWSFSPLIIGEALSGGDISRPDSAFAIYTAIGMLQSPYHRGSRSVGGLDVQDAIVVMGKGNYTKVYLPSPHHREAAQRGQPSLRLPGLKMPLIIGEVVQR